MGQDRAGVGQDAVPMEVVLVADRVEDPVVHASHLEEHTLVAFSVSLAAP